MNKKWVIPLIALLAGALAVTAVAWNRGEKEPFYLANIEAMRQLPEQDLLRMRADILKASAKRPDTLVTQPVPPGAVEIASGKLSGDSGREASGRVKLLHLPDGGRVVRLEAFRVTMAPDLRLRVSKFRPSDREQWAGDRVSDLGALEGNVGSQNFVLESEEPLGVVVESGIFSARMASGELKRER